MLTPNYFSMALTFGMAAIVAFGLTPLVKVLAGKVGAVDVPKDERRMHKVPTPRLGGLAIFFGFLFSTLLMCEITAELKGILLGSCVIVTLGVIDDIVALPAKPKLFIQIFAALIPALAGVKVEFLTNFNIFSDKAYFSLGWLSIPITVLWIVGITNSVNLIDGLDGLAVGVSSIAAISLLTISVLLSNGSVAMIAAALAGACIGFIPYNFNPAKIFMGDTGATFLGFMLATLSIQGLFKFYAVVSFAVPFLIFGLPIFDTTFAIVRRIASHRSPMSPDREHLHHRLIDFGFSQKQAVAIMYMLSAILGMAAVLLTTTGAMKAIILVFTAMVFTLGAGKLLEDRKRFKKEREEFFEKKKELEKELQKLERLQAELGIPISQSELMEAEERDDAQKQQ